MFYVVYLPERVNPFARLVASIEHKLVLKTYKWNLHKDIIVVMYENISI